MNGKDLFKQNDDDGIVATSYQQIWREAVCRNVEISFVKNGRFWNSLSGGVVRASRQACLVMNLGKLVNNLKEYECL